MIKRTTYTCEYCGKVFDNIDKCIQHENEEKEKFFSRTIKLFDGNKKEISVFDAIKNPESVYAIHFSSKEVRDFLSSKFSLYDKEPGLYVWSDFYHAWIDPKNVIEDMQEYMKAVEEAKRKEN